MDTQTKKGILFDSTLCIGCGGCYQACKEKNNLPRTADHFLRDNLSAQTYTVVKLRSSRFIRRMCMHCEQPACASVCPVGALQKTAAGPVVYDESKCMGCRYCMQACPFGVPTYEWDARLPRVRKCNLCADRVAEGLPSACAFVCPTGATKFGDRDALIAEAKARIRDNPGKYIDRVYGVEEVGGTSVLLISDVPIEQLGYRADMLKQPLPQLTWDVLQKIPKVVVAGGVLMSGVWWITNRRVAVQRAVREEKLRKAREAQSGEGNEMGQQMDQETDQH
jgi:formate dehydrogenase iron-sulfur subunit